MISRCSFCSAFAAAVLASLAIAPAGGEEAYQPDPRLVEAAKREGQVLLYTTHIVDQIVRPLIKGFQSRVPGIDVKYVRADGLQLVVRMSNEARAGRVQADAWSMVDGVGAILQAGLVAEFDVPSMRGLPATLADPNKRWVATNTAVRSAAYNTQLVPKDIAPRSYQDLLDPRWKGKIV